MRASDDTADSVTVEYFSKETWQTAEETVSLPDSTSDQPARVRLFGCTEKAQAICEGKYMAAANRYRRRLVTFQTELEGLIPTYGDLIAIAHDMPNWGQGAEVIAVDDNVLSLSEPLEWSQELGDHFISLRKTDGSVSGPWLALPGETPSQVVLQDELDFTPYTGELQERTHIAFGAGEKWSTLARVTAVRPRGELVEISAVAENPVVHTADQSPLKTGRVIMTADNHQRQDDMVCLPRTEFESLLEQAACRGARKALKEVGLADEEAANDIRTLRDLAGSIKTMQRTFLQTVVRWITIGVLALLVAGVAAKLGPFTPK